MIRFLTIAALVGLALATESAGAETAPAKPSQAGVEIRSVTVGGKALPLRLGEAVRTRVKSICQKMHARNRLEAVARHHASLE